MHILQASKWGLVRKNVVRRDEDRVLEARHAIQRQQDGTRCADVLVVARVILESLDKHRCIHICICVYVGIYICMFMLICMYVCMYVR